MSEAPIEPIFHGMMNGLAQGLDELLNGTDGKGKIVFALFMAEAGRIEGGRVNYISNGHREDMISMVREWLQRAEGAIDGQGGTA